MKIKRFQDRDARGAMSQVRAELGADAVILSNKTVNGLVELVAAVDIDEAAFGDKAADQCSELQFGVETSSDSQVLQDLQREMGNLRSLLETELSQLAWRDVATQPPVRTELLNRLRKLGLSRQLSGQVIENIPVKGDLRELWIKTLRVLASKLPVMGDKLLDEGGIIALVGTTGVGKTTTIAKLAARCIMRHGRREVALITTDCYRVGGQEQLETFAKYLGVPMRVATDGEQLKAALEEFSSRKLVLIDTAGMSQRDVRLYEQFSTLNSVGFNVATYAVLSATLQQGSMAEVIKTFGARALAGVMITKLDETTSLGAVLDTVIRNNLRLAYASNGQKVPEDIMPARAENLVAKAVELMEFETRKQTENDREFKAQLVAV